jgi:hypothetical protein
VGGKGAQEEDGWVEEFRMYTEKQVNNKNIRQNVGTPEETVGLGARGGGGEGWVWSWGRMNQSRDLCSYFLAFARIVWLPAIDINQRW